MKTIAPYQRLTRLFDTPTLSRILSGATDRHTLIELCNHSGISYAGMRTKSVASEKLVTDLVKKMFEGESGGETMAKILTRICAAEIALVRQIPSDAFAALPPPDSHALLRIRCRTLLAVALEEREELYETVPTLASQVVAYADDVVEPLQEETEPLADPVASIPSASSWDSKTMWLESQLATITEETERLVETNALLETQANQLREQVKTLQVELDALRHDNHGLERALSEKNREIERLQEELKNLPGLAAQINKLDRENRKMRYQLDHPPSPDIPAVQLQPMVLAMEKSADEVRETVRATALTLEAGYGDLRRILDELQREIHTLRVETQKDRQSERNARPMRRDQERVGIFVDVQNMFYAARQQSARLDFEKLMTAAVGERRMIRAMAYVIQSPEVDQTGFVSMLQQRSYQVKRKDLRQRSDGSAKGDWDMGMAIDMIGMADKLDVVVLVSGDGDFVALVHLLKEMGPRVEVFSFLHNTARDLMEAADHYYAIDESLLIKMDRTPAMSREPESTPVQTAEE